MLPMPRAEFCLLRLDTSTPERNNKYRNCRRRKGLQRFVFLKNMKSGLRRSKHYQFVEMSPNWRFSETFKEF